MVLFIGRGQKIPAIVHVLRFAGTRHPIQVSNTEHLQLITSHSIYNVCVRLSMTSGYYRWLIDIHVQVLTKPVGTVGRRCSRHIQSPIP